MFEALTTVGEMLVARIGPALTAILVVPVWGLGLLALLTLPSYGGLWPLAGGSAFAIGLLYVGAAGCGLAQRVGQPQQKRIR